MIYLKWWKGRTYNQEYPESLSFRFDGEIKSFPDKQKFKEFSFTAKISFTTNAKGTSLGRKHKRRKRPSKNKPKTIEKMVIGSYILIITLNVNGLNAPTKRHRPDRRMKTCACMHFHLAHHSVWPPKLYAIILYC